MQELFQLRFDKSPPVTDKNGQPTARSWRLAVLIFAVLVMALSLHGTPQEPASPGPPAFGDDQPTGNDGPEPFDPEAQQKKLAAINDFAARADALEGYLRDRDPVIGMAAYYALGARSKRAALQAVIDVVNDATEPVRLQALQLLLGSDIDKADEQAVARVLRAALDDPDPAFVILATEALAASDDPADERALMDALRDGSLATRLLIVQSVGRGEAAKQYLNYALRDSDETVRNAAESILSQPRTD